jgi:anthranilate synthase component 2/putative glutamine amidotransferase
MRPLIGISTYREQARWGVWDVPAVLLPASYADAVADGGGEPVLLPTGSGTAEVVARFDGLVLAGGADVDPTRYGAAPGPHTVPRPDRDAAELAVLQGALDRDLPLLAICRGMQLLNVALGGTLNQHLVGDDGVPLHRRIVGTFEGTEHEIDLEPGSLAERALGGPTHEARCHHHQAVDRVGDGLIVSGRARDGVIEAIELPDQWALGVQWHPEAGDKRELFHAFTRAAAALPAAQRQQ